MRLQVKSIAALLSVVLSLSVAMILLTSTSCVEARYLPTRADETDVEVLKEIIRELVSQSALEATEAHLSNRFNQPRQVANQQRHFLLDRQSRAAELPQASSGESSLRVMASS